jgi:FkbM family methyltransferase
MISSLKNKLSRSFSKEKNKKYQYEIMKSGFHYYQNLCRNVYVSNILFSDDQTVITLKDGRKYFFDPFSKINKLYTVPTTGTFEPEETEMVKNLVKQGDICVDIGGSFGWYTILLSKLVGDEGEVFVFEPISYNYTALSNNIKLNDCRNVFAHNLALGGNSSEIDIYLSDIDTSGSLKLRKYEKSYETQKVKIIKLDDFFTENKLSRVDFIKADVEGAELGVLKGAKSLLQKCMPTLFLEIQRKHTELFGYTPSDIFNYLYQLGYLSYVISGNKLEKFTFREPLPTHNFFFNKG